MTGTRFPSIVMDDVSSSLRYRGFVRLIQALSWAALVIGEQHTGCDNVHYWMQENKT